jgi:hypothetical protein
VAAWTAEDRRGGCEARVLRGMSARSRSAAARIVCETSPARMRRDADGARLSATRRTTAAARETFSSPPPMRVTRCGCSS